MDNHAEGILGEDKEGNLMVDILVVDNPKEDILEEGRGDNLKVDKEYKVEEDILKEDRVVGNLREDSQILINFKE